ncbi:IS66-like element accessory protein TnpA [Achromobacter xylosoxidans]|uniref:IS66-like element accessory protein TnpA n=1 Tax=Alcaligenes xylosoxydans xylosoxydans TaxID=85698 RepID=UPI000B490147|nr:transposase [Achromobacter xylosoxidans]
MDDYRNAPRRRHDVEFKVEVVRACGEPGASVAAVALRYGLNANLVRQWVRGRGFKRGGALVAVAAAAQPSAQRFVPLALPKSAAATPAQASPTGDIRVAIRRAALHVDVSWPQSGGADCAAWLRELLR